jgi:hypothetical protein
LFHGVTARLERSRSQSCRASADLRTINRPDGGLEIAAGK